MLTRSLVSSQQPSAATLDISTASASLHSETLPSTRNASPAAARDSPASSSGGSSSNYRPLSLESLRGGEGSDGELPFQDPQDRRDEQQHFALATQQRNSYYISYRAQLASSDQQHATPQRPRLRVLPRQQSQPQAALLQHLEEEPAHLLHRQLSQPPILNPARHTQVPNSGLSGMPGTGAFGDMGSQPLLLNSLSSPAQHATTSLAPSSSPMRPSAHPPGAAPLTSQPTSANTQYGGPSPARQEPQQQQQHHHHQQQSQHGYPHGHLQLLHLTAAAGGGPVGPSALWPAASQHTREGGAGVSAPSGPFAGSWAGPAGPVATAAVAGCFGRQGVPEWEDEGLCCRVCMEPVGQDDLTSGLALRLGCRWAHLPVNATCSCRIINLRRPRDFYLHILHLSTTGRKTAGDADLPRAIRGAHTASLGGPIRCSELLWMLLQHDHHGCAAGCRCSSGLDVIHAVCAERWFRGVRGETVCEVCGAEAHNLPASVKADIRWVHSMLHTGPPAHWAPCPTGP